VILGVVGPDVSRFPKVEHLTSWLGLCPHDRGSAGKLPSRRTCRGMSRAARALRLAVHSCHNAKHALTMFYRRIRDRARAPKAIVATARNLAEWINELLRQAETYVRQAVEAYEASLPGARGQGAGASGGGDGLPPGTRGDRHTVGEADAAVGSASGAWTTLNAERSPSPARLSDHLPGPLAAQPRLQEAAARHVEQPQFAVARPAAQKLQHRLQVGGQPLGFDNGRGLPGCG
jgi:hypothetical protein